MKKPILTFLALTILVPGIAFADTTIVTKETNDGTYVTRPAPVSETLMPSYMDTVTSTVTKTTIKNSRSDTEYLADRPDAGIKRTEVEVHEQVNFR